MAKVWGRIRTQWKTRLLEYCQSIDGALRPVLADSKIPLVLAADASLVPIYRRAHSYPHTLMDRSIIGSPDNLSDKELRDAAWPMICQHNASLTLGALAEFGQAAAQECASAELEDILPAAMDGRVDKLLVADRCHCWGKFDMNRRSIVVRDRAHNGDEDLINMAALLAYQKGAHVLTFQRDEMHNVGRLAAIFRY